MFIVEVSVLVAPPVGEITKMNSSLVHLRKNQRSLHTGDVFVGRTTRFNN